MKSRILVCGGRDFEDDDLFDRKLDEARPWFASEFVIIQGGARGADKIAKSWAEARGIPCIGMDANWMYYKKKAGPVRNKWMLDWTLPDLVIAFPGGNGTANMMKQARARHVEVWEI